MSAGASMVSVDGRRVPLRSVAFEGAVSGAHARACVRQTFVNEEAQPVEAVYTFPLPSDAVLVAFSMRCGGRALSGAVREREEAFRAYDEALAQGHGAALVEQERANVFTVQVGHLLPGEETVVEVEFLQRLGADEGALRWAIPTLVAPRYVPGTPEGDRTGHGYADPTARVKDADRVTPEPGEDAGYSASLEVTFDLGRSLAISSPSHALAVEELDGGRARVRFASGTAALDRDIVLTACARGAEALAPVQAHRSGSTGTFALSVVPDLFVPGQAPERRDVVFVVDVSGSMGGASLEQARAALRLCLRHLREGDRFGLIAFQTTFTAYAPELRPFTQAELERADAFVAGLAAGGGTEMLEPLLAALRMAPDATVVLLTDGQVANEDEILSRVLERRGRARVFAFGIGTSVSDALLLELSRRSGGGMEWIHPGERLDEKVVAQFARAVAPRVEEMMVEVEGVEAAELTPEPPPALVEGEVWSLLGRYREPGRGRLRIRGRRGGEPFELVVPFTLPERSEQAHLEKLWAGSRIKDAELELIRPERAPEVERRIRKLALQHGVASRFTSFVVIEEREGARRSEGPLETRVVPVHFPAGWQMFEKQEQRRAFQLVLRQASGGGPGSGAVLRPKAVLGEGGGIGLQAQASMALPPRPQTILESGGGGVGVLEPAPAPVPPPSAAQRLLERQLASGLWEGGLRATAAALLELRREGVDTAHPVYGAQVRKAVTAVAVLATAAPHDEEEGAAVELALCAAWLSAAGARTRTEIERAARTRSADAWRWVGDAALTRSRAEELSRR